MDRLIDSLPCLTDSAISQLHTIVHTIEWKNGFLCGLYTAALIVVLYYFIGSTDGYFPPQRYHTLDLSKAELLAEEVISELAALIPEKPPKPKPAPVSKHNRKDIEKDSHPEVPYSAPIKPTVVVEETFIPGHVPDDWEFQQYVNMTPKELEAWLKTQNSIGAGIMKEGATESVGHDSGRHILNILKRNPNGDEGNYTEEDIQHMRKVVAYCKRHIAGEQGAMLNESSKSHKSLKNWGHDAIKAAEGA